MADEKLEDKKPEPEPVEDLTPPAEPEEVPELEDEGEPKPVERPPHPLAPGGRRFEQIYAKGKSVERENAALKERLAALEARVNAPAPTDEKEYTWAELETFIQQGRITRADAEAHREEFNTKRLAKKLKDEFTRDITQKTRDQALTQTVQDYITAVPTIMKEDSVDRRRVEDEFGWLAAVQGLDPDTLDESQRKVLQVTAMRNVFGSLDALKTRSSVKTETHQGISGGTPPTAKPNPDQALLNKLTPAQTAHYKKMMAAGRYKGGWKDVVAELKYERKRR